MGVGISSVTANSIVTVVPERFALFSTRIVARCASAMPLQIASPRPEPRGLVVTKGLKTFPIISSGMPVPVSLTWTRREGESTFSPRSGGRSGKSTKASYQIIDTGDLADDDLRKVLSKILFREPFRK